MNSSEKAVSIPCINIIMLCIENIGTGTAHNVQFVTDLSFKPDGRRPLEQVGFLKNGVAYFQPGRKIEQFLVSVTDADKFEKLKQTPLEIGVTYSDSANHKRERTFHLDFGEHEGLPHVDRPPLFEIAKSMRELQRTLNSIGTGLRKPIILTEPLAGHRLGQRKNLLEGRLDELPDEIQEELLDKLASIINEKEQEGHEKKWNEQATTENSEENESEVSQ